MRDIIEIELSKKKIAILLIGASIFIVLGIFFSINPEKFTTSRFSNPDIIRFVGIVALVFFGFCALFLAKKLFDNRIGLTINQDGIIDNSSGTSVGLVEWNDITHIEEVQVASTKFILLMTTNPEKYIEKAKNGISRRAMKANYKMYGSPISITSGALKMNHRNLKDVVIAEFEKAKA